MASKETCAGCLRVKENNVADLWCNDCEEPVCRPCSKVHRKFSIPHDIKEIKKLSNFKKTSTKNCKVHAGQKLIFFCVRHDEILCTTCLSGSHIECDINHIEKTAMGIKESSELHNLKERIHKQKYVIEKLKKEFDELSGRIHKNKEQQFDRLNQLRLGVEDCMNQLEKNMETHYSQVVEKLSSNSNQLNFLEQTTEENTKEIENTKKLESEVNLLYLLKRLNTIQKSDEEKIQCLEKDINTMLFQFIPENVIENVDAMVHVLGTQQTLSKSPQGSSMAQQSQLHIHSEENQPIKHTRKFNADESCMFYGCCFIDENNVITIKEKISYNQYTLENIKTLYLQVINLQDGLSNSFQIDSECATLCKDTICTVDSNNVLLVGGDGIYLMDLESEILARTIKVDNDHSITCKLVTFIESQIVVLCQQMIDEKMCDYISWIDYNGISLKKLSLPGDVCDLVINDSQVYCTFNDVNNVTCTSFSGESHIYYTSLDLIESCKITAGDSIIVLLEMKRNAIYTVDPKTLKRSKIHERIFHPTHMNLNKKTKELAVTCNNGTCLKIFNSFI